VVVEGVVMAEWLDQRTGAWHTFEVPAPQLTVTDNPVVGVLLGPAGEVVREVRERAPIGFR